MDMRKYASSFIRFEDVRDGNLQKTVSRNEEGDYERPVLTFTDGDQLTLNKTNVRALRKAYGDNGRDWIGKVIELYAGQTDYNGQNTTACWSGRSRRARNPMSTRRSSRKSPSRAR